MRFASLILFIFCSDLIFAQSPVADTKPVKDSLQDIKSDVIENLPTLILADDDFDDGGQAVVSSILTAARDPFLMAAAFNFSPVRFRLRGYENNGDAMYINGIDFTGLDNGFTPYSLWSGLNNVMRSQQQMFGLEANDFAIGNLALNTNVDMRAGAQRAQTQAGYAFSNRNYMHRLTVSHGSGFNQKGWAYSFAFASRYANEGYVPGTYYRGISYYAAVDKRLNDKNTISAITFGAPTEAGRQGPAVQEAMNLARTNYYNPSWGWQQGKKRNSNVMQTFQPVIMMVHEYKPGNNSRLTTSAAYAFGKRKNSGFDWYNAADPRPDYYRYLPSYFEAESPATAASLKESFLNNTDLLQVNWNHLYEANRSNNITINNVNGQPGNRITGKRSVYILSNRVNDVQRIILNTVYNARLGNIASLTTGINYQRQQNEYYQEVKDLLGGDFWVNINQFAERDFPDDPRSVQYDVNHPNRIIKQGDQYGYHYTMTMNRSAAWAQVLFKLNKIDFFVTGELAHTGFYRTGFNKNGLFPELSFGKADAQSFTNPSAKAGVTYKLNGRNYFFANGAYMSNPPYFENAYISQRTRNSVQNNVKSETYFSGEAGYKFNAPRVKLGLTTYYTTSKDGLDVLTFYHDQFQNFVNYALSGIDKVYFGTELGAEVKLTSTLTFNGAASIGRYYYNSRQHAVVTVDNNAQILANQTIYLKNFRIPSTPQNAYSGGLFYRSPKYWYVSLTGNYFSNMWLSPNPLRRTVETIGDADPTQENVQQKISEIIDQQKMESRFTLDFFGGWSKRMPRQYNVRNKPLYLVFTLGVNNILNNKTIKSGGFEQLRFDYEEKNVNKFPPKYYYAYGLNYFASMAIRF